MKKLSKQLMAFAIISLLVLPFLAFHQAAAQNDSNTLYGLNAVNNGLNGSLTQSDPITVATKVINIALGFLGIIAVGIILIGGFKWMTAGGNEDKTSEAKKLLGAGIIGLVIILASWAIAFYVINTLATKALNTQ